MTARFFESVRAAIGGLGERPKYFDEMLKLFFHSCFSARGKVEGVKERREVVYELQFLCVNNLFFGHHIKSSSIGHGSGVFG